jgi:hypothetical protein
VTWRMVARLTHLSDAAQRRLWRMLITAWAVLLIAAWAALSAFTRLAEKAYEEAGQTYLSVAPLAAEVMDLRDRRGQLQSLAPLVAAEQAARTAGVGADRLRIIPEQGLSGQLGLRLHASGLTLRELVELLRDLRLLAGLSTTSAGIYPAPGNGKRADLDLVLER